VVSVSIETKNFSTKVQNHVGIVAPTVELVLCFQLLVQYNNQVDYYVDDERNEGHVCRCCVVVSTSS